MRGAICAQVQAGEFDKAVSPAIILLVSWVGTWLRHPQNALEHDERAIWLRAKRIDGGGMMRVRHKLARGGG